MEKGKKKASGKEKTVEKIVKGKKRVEKKGTKTAPSNISDKIVTKDEKENFDTSKDDTDLIIDLDDEGSDEGVEEGLKTPETLEIPEDWKEKNVESLVNQGFKSYIKNVQNRQYIILKKANKVESLGRFSLENWTLLHTLFPKLVSTHNENVPQGVPQDDFPLGNTVSSRIMDANAGRNSNRKPHFLGIKLERPIVFPSKYVPTLKIMRFYEIYRSDGGSSEFTDFINDIVETHLRKCHGFLIDKLVYVGE